VSPAFAALSVAATAAAVALAVPGARSLPPVRRGPTGQAGSAGRASRARGAASGGSEGAQGAEGGSRALRVTSTVAVTAGALFFVGGGAGAIAGFIAGAVCWWATGRLEPPAVRRRRERLAAAVPSAVDLLAACLAVGLSPAAALEQITEAVDPPLSDELAELTARLRMGVDAVTVWRDLARHPQLGGLGRAVSRAVESGASVADAMLRLADDLRRRHRAEVENRARAVGVKAALPLGVCLLPAFVLVGVVPLVAGSVSVLLGR
jgi:Flp pilus assembly protein TadB